MCKMNLRALLFVTPVEWQVASYPSARGSRLPASSTQRVPWFGNPRLKITYLPLSTAVTAARVARCARASRTMAETIEESYETAVTRKVIRTSLKIEEVRMIHTALRNGRASPTLSPAPARAPPSPASRHSPRPPFHPRTPDHITDNPLDSEHGRKHHDHAGRPLCSRSYRTLDRASSPLFGGPFSGSPKHSRKTIAY